MADEVPLPFPEVGRVFLRESGASASARFVCSVEGDVVRFADLRPEGPRHVRPVIVLNDGRRYPIRACTFDRWCRWARHTRKLPLEQSQHRGWTYEECDS